jgi:hypothetical protein
VPGVPFGDGIRLTARMMVTIPPERIGRMLYGKAAMHTSVPQEPPQSRGMTTHRFAMAVISPAIEPRPSAGLALGRQLLAHEFRHSDGLLCGRYEPRAFPHLRSVYRHAAFKAHLESAHMVEFRVARWSDSPEGDFHCN